MATSEEMRSEIHELIAARERDGILGLAGRISPAEWADVVHQLDDDELAVLLEWLPDDQVPLLLEELDPAQAAAILLTYSRSEAADLLEQMAPDDATDVLGEMQDAEAELILVEMEPEEAAEIRELSAYPDDTAGGIMTPAFTAIDPELRADQAIQALRRVAEQAETVYYVYVLDAEEHLLGVLSLHSLVLAQPNTPVRSLMIKDVFRVRADADQEIAARLLTDHNLLALPVVDEEDRLLGIITQDDIADVLQEEATEDIERLGGSQPLETSYRLAPIWLLVRRRLGWLMILFFAEAYTSTVLKHYEHLASEQVALTLFYPLLIGTGGNVGSQTVTTLVRAMGLGEVQLRDIRWVIFKETAVAATMGLVMAAIAFGRASLLHVGSDIGLVVGLTVLAVCIWSAFVAAILPLVLKTLRVDPAVVSAPLITTLVDGTGLIIYFTIAARVLSL